MLFNDDSLFETMLDVIPFGIYVVDVKTYEIVYMNRALIRKQGNFIGKICHRAFYEEERPCIFCRNLQLVDETFRPTNRTIVFEHFNEMDDTWYQLQEKGMMWPDGRTVKYSIAVEISELKQVQNQLAEAHAELALKNRQLEAATKAKSMFLASMSHEIRTPMNAIIGLSDLALKADMNPKVRDYVKKISLSAKSLLGIINDILDFSKIEAGRMDLERISFLLPDVLAHLSGVFYFKTAEKGIEFIISVDTDVPWGLLGDPTRLSQVLTNLMANAVKFTESGEIVIRVAVVEKKDHRARLRFSVSDTGIGIPEDKLPGLFAPFMQMDGSTTRKYGGTGLGLSICKRLVEKMDGKIWARSRKGKGSEFTFEVTLGLVPESEQARAMLPLDLRGLNILLADDNPISLNVMEKQLSSLLFNVAAVSSGEELMAKLTGPAGTPEKWDLIITDWKMGGMDGMAVCKAIREDARFDGIPIILASAFDKDGELMEFSEKTGVNACLHKPVNPSSLFDTIMEVFGRAPDSNSRQPFTPDTDMLETVRGASLLVVDDNDINRQVARELLENAGFRVETAENGRQAFDRVRTKAFDAVLMDIQMPGMDGHTCTQKIREWEIKRQPAPCRRLPVIAMTAHALEGDRKKSLAAGMDGHVTKPIDTRQLFKALAEHIRPGKRNPLPVPGPKPAGFPPDLPEQLPGIDMDEALKRLAGNTGLYRELLLRFRAQALDMGTKIRHAVEAGEKKQAVFMCHTLKGLSGNIGARTVHDTLDGLEKSLDENAPDACQKSIHRLAAEIDRVVKGIDRRIRKTAPPPEPGDRQLSGSAPQDVEQAGAAVRTLRRLLLENDGQALDQVRTLRSMAVFRGSPGLAEVDAKINDLDFEAALALLDGLEKELDAF